MDFGDLRNMGIDPSLIDHLHEILDFSDDTGSKQHHAPSRAFVAEKRAMAATPADAKESPNAFVFVLDMPGLKPDQIKVQIEENNTLVVSGERKREKENGVKYMKMERRLGKYLKMFVLPENADTDKISAMYQDGVLTVTVGKKPPPPHKQPRTVEVQIG